MNKSIIEISQPVGKIDVPAGAIVESDAQRNANRYVPIGRFDSKLRTTKMDEHGISPIGMNQSGVLALKPEENGIIATCSLAGCIGLAGFAKLQNGELLLLISHADAISQQYKMAGRGSDVVKQMYTFEHDTREALGGGTCSSFSFRCKRKPKLSRHGRCI